MIDTLWEKMMNSRFFNMFFWQSTNHEFMERHRKCRHGFSEVKIQGQDYLAPGRDQLASNEP
jgi:hypothetical protein